MTFPQPARAALLALLLLSGCGSADEGGGAPQAPPLVKVAPPQEHVFAVQLEAVGTAGANEQVTISAPVTERVQSLYFDDGDYVRKGALIAVLAQGQERAALAAAQATEEQAKTQYDRIQSLSDRGFATRAQLDLQVATLARARADADDARAQIEDRTVRAPFSGAVSLRTISAGSIVPAGAPIAVISDISRIKLDFTLPEVATGSLRPGQTVQASSPAYPGVVFAGKISSIDPVIDASTRSITVRAVLPNSGNRLKPGMLMEVVVQLARRAAPAVPELAVVGEGSTRFVYVLGKDGKVRRTHVTTGLRDDGLIEVEGLPKGARVVTEGVIKLADGMEVSVEGAKSSGASSSAKAG